MPGFLGATKQKKMRIYHPEENWVVVPVPPIVSPELWEAAVRACAKNKNYSERNGDGKFLLTGLVKCATCGSSFHGASLHNLKKDAYSSQYRCSSRVQPLLKRMQLNCKQGTISKNLLEGLVWDLTRDALLHPEPLLAALDALVSSEANESLLAQIDYLEREIANLKTEDQRLTKAYFAGAFNEDEYAEMRSDIKKRESTAKKSILTLESQIITPESIEAQKYAILQIAAKAQAKNLTKPENIDDQTKKALIQTIFSRITLDLTGGVIAVEGLFSGAWAFVRDTKTVKVVGSLDYSQTSR